MPHMNWHYDTALDNRIFDMKKILEREQHRVDVTKAIRPQRQRSGPNVAAPGVLQADGPQFAPCVVMPRPSKWLEALRQSLLAPRSSCSVYTCSLECGHSVASPWHCPAVAVFPRSRVVLSCRGVASSGPRGALFLVVSKHPSTLKRPSAFFLQHHQQLLLLCSGSCSAYTRQDISEENRKRLEENKEKVPRQGGGPPGLHTECSCFPLNEGRNRTKGRGANHRDPTLAQREGVPQRLGCGSVCAKRGGVAPLEKGARLRSAQRVNHEQGRAPPEITTMQDEVSVMKNVQKRQRRMQRCVDARDAPL